MNLSFTKLGWEHFTEWFTNQRILKKINALVEDILSYKPPK
jgi:Txe/YoeB family toxin of Txe-Axe toxin-antitoxin module